MYYKQIVKKSSPSFSSTPISKQTIPTPSYGSLSGTIQRAVANPESLSRDETLQLHSAIGTRATNEIISGQRTSYVPEFQGISAQLKGDFGQVSKPIQRRESNDAGMSQAPPENKTGLPNNLKTGVENLSGISMNDVKVHYNSSQPAQLQALAYTQGTNIHVAPGEEKHLPHEAWHVVQQKQGRVEPTLQMKQVNINDDRILETEADVMGTKALKMGNNSQHLPYSGESQTSKNSSISNKPLDTTIQRHPEHWRTGTFFIDDLLRLPPGSATFGRTKLGRIQEAIRRYQRTGVNNYAARKTILNAIETDINARKLKPEYSSATRDEAYQYLESILNMIQYEREEMMLSEQRDQGLLDLDDPQSWQQSKGFPVTQHYEITFRAIPKLNLGGRGITEPVMLGTMNADDQEIFEKARPTDVVTHANTGANVSGSRSFDFTDSITREPPYHPSKSNIIVVQVVRPGYGIDVEEHAYNIERAGTTPIDPGNRQKTREAKEVATLRNPLELIIGWVEIRRTEKRGPTVATYTENPDFRLPAGMQLSNIRNYNDYVSLRQKYG